MVKFGRDRNWNQWNQWNQYGQWGGQFYQYPRKMMPKWGHDLGIAGENSRNILLRSVSNYIRMTHGGYNFYISLINGFYPKFLRYETNDCERWRMRFNIFASGVYEEWHPNTVLHIGELQMYYDIMSQLELPWGSDYTFYFDNRENEIPVLENRVLDMESALKDSLDGNDRVMMEVLKLPIKGKDFANPGGCLDQFLHRQSIMMDHLKCLQQQKQENTENYYY